jgi:GAF domain-containing protein
MLSWIKRFFAAPIFEGDDEKTRVASSLNAILLVSLALSVVFGLTALIASPNPAFSLALTSALIPPQLIALLLMHRSRVRLASLIFSAVLWAGVTYSGFRAGGVRSASFTVYTIVILIAGTLLGWRAGAAFIGLSVVAGAVMLYVDAGGLSSPLISVTPLYAWTTQTVSFVAAAALLYLATRDINAALKRARNYAADLQEHQEHLEDTVEERTRDLLRRTRYLEATTEVAHRAAAVLDTEELLEGAVALIGRLFSFCHAGIFLTDPVGEWAVLQAASTEGEQQQSPGFRVRVGDTNAVGHATSLGESWIARGADISLRFKGPDGAPATSSEAALPLWARGEIIGALNVHSTEPDAFGEEAISILQTLADLVAMAISTARLFEQAQESLRAEQHAYGALSRDAWRALLRSQPSAGVTKNSRGTSPARDVSNARVEQAIRAGETVHGENGSAELATPIKVRGQVIGVIDAHKAAEAGTWTPEHVALLEALADQLGMALESARLYQDSQRHAAREQVIGDIASRMRQTLDMETVLKTATQEVRRALGLREVTIRLAAQPMDENDHETD